MCTEIVSKPIFIKHLSAPLQILFVIYSFKSKTLLFTNLIEIFYKGQILRYIFLNTVVTATLVLLEVFLKLLKNWILIR